jgi:hypothetical protein
MSNEARLLSLVWGRATDNNTAEFCEHAYKQIPVRWRVASIYAGLTSTDVFARVGVSRPNRHASVQVMFTDSDHYLIMV